MDNQQETKEEKLTMEVVTEWLNKNISKNIELGSIIGVLFIACVWTLKSIWYFFYLGKFACYGIDSSYINAESENVFLQIIYTIALLVVWFYANLLFYRIATYKKSKIVRIGKLIVLCVIEGLILFIVVMGMSNTNVFKLIREMNMKIFLVFVIVQSLLVIAVNTFAISSLWGKWIENREKKRKKSPKKNSVKRKSKDDSVDINKNTQKVRTIVAFIGTLSVMLFLIFGASWFCERFRTNYKIIMDDNVMQENEMVVLNPENKEGVVYIVIHEDEDEYIVTKLSKIGSEMVMDYDYLKSISKENIATYYVRDIYDIDYKR